MNANGSGDVLDLLLAHVFECEVELIAHLISNNAAYANSAGFGQGGSYACAFAIEADLWTIAHCG
jgi:hypothetical protein